MQSAKVCQAKKITKNPVSEGRVKEGKVFAYPVNDLLFSWCDTNSMRHILLSLIKQITKARRPSQNQ